MQPLSEATDSRPVLVGIGEALFDLFPHQEILGGAPLNAVAVAAQLGKHWPARSVMVSRVGRDLRGETIIRECQQRFGDAHFIQVDSTLPTGTVQVEIKGTEPCYTIASPAAWDALIWDKALETLATTCHGVIFGTLAQRDPRSRETIQQFIYAARSAIRLLDVNLRQTFYSREVLEASFALANVVKLNQEELSLIAESLGWSVDQTVVGLLSGYQLKAVILTHGKAGTELILPSQSFKAEVPQFPQSEHADSVGAGDACAAVCLLGLVANWPSEKIVARANRFAAYVASQPGATPMLPQSLFDLD